MRKLLNSLNPYYSIRAARYIGQGLMITLSHANRLQDTNQEIEFQLFAETYQLLEPLINEKDAVYESLTYSAELYVSTGLIWKQIYSIPDK